jgi:hypothetical protein
LQDIILGKRIKDKKISFDIKQAISGGFSNAEKPDLLKNFKKRLAKDKFIDQSE